MTQNDLLNVWRCIIALAHADGHLSAEEKEFIREYITSNTHISHENRQILLNDLSNENLDFDSYFGQIESPQKRAYFINMARVLCFKDSVFCPLEQAVLKKAHKNSHTTVELEKIVAEAKEEAEREKQSMNETNKDRRNLLDKALDRLNELF